MKINILVLSVFIIVLGALAWFFSEPLYYLYEREFVRNPEWNGYRVELGQDIYLRPRLATGEIFIADRKNKAILVLYPRGSLFDEKRKIIETTCVTKKCVFYREIKNKVDDRPVYSIEYLLTIDAGEQMLQKLVWIKGSPVMIEFSGRPEAYVNFEPTIESLVRQIALSVRQ